MPLYMSKSMRMYKKKKIDVEGNFFFFCVTAIMADLWNVHALLKHEIKLWSYSQTDAHLFNRTKSF